MKQRAVAGSYPLIDAGVYIGLMGIIVGCGMTSCLWHPLRGAVIVLVGYCLTLGCALLARACDRVLVVLDE